MRECTGHMDLPLCDVGAFIACIAKGGVALAMTMETGLLEGPQSSPPPRGSCSHSKDNLTSMPYCRLHIGSLLAHCKLMSHVLVRVFPHPTYTGLKWFGG